METTITCPRCDEDYATRSCVKHFPCKCEVCFHCVLQLQAVRSHDRLVCHCGVEVSKHSTLRRQQTKTRRGESITFREDVMEHFVPDPVPPTKKPRPPPSTDTLDYLKKLANMTPQDLIAVGKGILVTDTCELRLTTKTKSP
jgi:hypothetical protein